MREVKAVFLDRDGVLNRVLVRNGKPYPPCNLSELKILPGVTEALNRLHNAGFILIVITNQPDVVRGTQKRAVVEEINGVLQAQLRIDEFRVCWHDDADGCDCRKPKPGALLQAADKFGIDLSASFMIGDRWRDIEAGKLAGCKTVLIDYHYAETNHSRPHYRTSSLTGAVDWILKRKGDSSEKLWQFEDQDFC